MRPPCLQRHLRHNRARTGDAWAGSGVSGPISPSHVCCEMPVGVGEVPSYFGQLAHPSLIMTHSHSPSLTLTQPHAASLALTRPHSPSRTLADPHSPSLALALTQPGAEPHARPRKDQGSPRSANLAAQAARCQPQPKEARRLCHRCYAAPRRRGRSARRRATATRCCRVARLPSALGRSCWHARVQFPPSVLAGLMPIATGGGTVFHHGAACSGLTGRYRSNHLV